LEFRNTPLQEIGKSPSQLLLSRRTRTLLPIAESLLTPAISAPIQHALEHRQKQQKFYHDKYGTKELSHLHEGQAARIWDGKLWQPAMVTKSVGNRSYMVQTRSGQTYRRNRSHLMATKEKPIVIEKPLACETDRATMEKSFACETDCATMEKPFACETDRATMEKPFACVTDRATGLNQPDLGQPDLDPNIQQKTTRSGRVIKTPNRLDL